MENEKEPSSRQPGNKSSFLMFIFVTIGVFLTASYILSLSADQSPSLVQFVAEEVNAVASKLAEYPKEWKKNETIGVDPENKAEGVIGEGAASGLMEHCQSAYKKKKQCPEDVCMFNCFGAITYEGCEKGCYPKPCLEIDVESCPLSDCQILKGCNDINRCYPQIDSGLECGDLAYQGQDVECCEGMVRRCGLEYFDRTCDMVAEKSVYGVPICVPCGNGICNQFENRCNCPEDCGTP